MWISFWLCLCLFLASLCYMSSIFTTKAFLVNQIIYLSNGFQHNRNKQYFFLDVTWKHLCYHYSFLKIALLMADSNANDASRAFFSVSTDPSLSSLYCMRSWSRIRSSNIFLQPWNLEIRELGTKWFIIYGSFIRLFSWDVWRKKIVIVLPFHITPTTL